MTPYSEPDVRDIEPHRARLFGIAYRMLGDAHDAEDIVQETALRWHETDRLLIQSSEAWLVTVATRLSIDRLRSAKVERNRYVGHWLPEPIVHVDALIDQCASASPAREVEMASDLSMALLVLLERLGPVERAAFLLRDVFDCSYDEIARVLERAEPTVRQLVHRARTHVRSGPRFRPARAAQTALLDRFLVAVTNDDQDALLALFDARATFTSDGGGKASAIRNILHGRVHIVSFLRGIERKAAGRLVHRVVMLNGEPSIVSEVCLPGEPPWLFCATTFATDGNHIHAVYRVLNPDKLQHLTGEI